VLALDSYRNAIRCAPLDDFYHICLAAAYLHARQLQEAQAVFERAVQLRPHNASYHFLLAELLEWMGARGRAARHYALAGELDDYELDYVQRVKARANGGLR